MKGWPCRQPHLAASSSASFLTDLYVLPAPFFTLRMWFEISWSSSRAEYVVNHNCSGSRSCIFLEQCMSGSHFRHSVRVTQSLVSAGPVVVLLQCALFFKKTKTKGAVQCLTAALTELLTWALFLTSALRLCGRALRNHSNPGDFTITKDIQEVS